MVEHVAHNDAVVGSTPSKPIPFSLKKKRQKKEVFQSLSCALLYRKSEGLFLNDTVVEKTTFFRE